MVKSILSEKNSAVVLGSHQDLSHGDIVQDCLEKIHSLSQICTGGFDISSLPLPAQHQFFALLNDLVELALGHYLIFQEHCEYEDEWEYDN